MEEQLITFKTAKLAKEKGFDVPVQYGVYGKKMKLTESMGNDRYPKPELTNWNAESKQQKHSKATSVPTQSLLQKWLREVHGIYINIFVETHTHYDTRVFRYGEFGSDMAFHEFSNYEEALEKGLQEALKLI